MLWPGAITCKVPSSVTSVRNSVVVERGRWIPKSRNTNRTSLNRSGFTVPSGLIAPPEQSGQLAVERLLVDPRCMRADTERCLP